eukprot:559996-Prymnesium_polylepis.1
MCQSRSFATAYNLFVISSLLYLTLTLKRLQRGEKPDESLIYFTMIVPLPIIFEDFRAASLWWTNYRADELYKASSVPSATE